MLANKGLQPTPKPLRGSVAAELRRSPPVDRVRVRRSHGRVRVRGRQRRRHCLRHIRCGDGASDRGAERGLASHPGQLRAPRRVARLTRPVIGYQGERDETQPGRLVRDLGARPRPRAALLRSRVSVQARTARFARGRCERHADAELPDGDGRPRQRRHARQDGLADGPWGGLGTMVYFACEVCEVCAVEQARVEAAGGKVFKPKFAIGQYGHSAIIVDTEGNMIGLHSMK